MSTWVRLHLFYAPASTQLRGFGYRDIDEEKGTPYWYPNAGEYLGCYEGISQDTKIYEWAYGRIKLLGLGNHIAGFINFMYPAAESPLG